MVYLFLISLIAGQLLFLILNNDDFLGGMWALWQRKNLENVILGFIGDVISGAGYIY